MQKWPFAALWLQASQGSTDAKCFFIKSSFKINNVAEMEYG